ncbi:MAG: hypothetical protein ACK55Q_09465 [Dolichospermum sp.]
MNHDGNMEPFLADEPPEDYDEDNDELDDAQGDAPARKRRVLFYTLEQKGKNSGGSLLPASPRSPHCAEISSAACTDP